MSRNDTKELLELVQAEVARILDLIEERHLDGHLTGGGFKYEDQAGLDGLLKAAKRSLGDGLRHDFSVELCDEDGGSLAVFGEGC